MQANIDISFGYPFAISVRNIPQLVKVKENGVSKMEMEPLIALRNLVICHDIKTAINEYVRATHEKYRCTAEVELYIMGEKKAPDGVWEQDNQTISKFTVVAPKKVPSKKKEENGN